tara:strand:- start:1699 stop:1956 length:258 start_codon:yes stop_codon:yes gene_type:complete
MNEELKFRPGSICPQCVKVSFYDEATHIGTTYCRHNETGAICLPIAGELRWMTINRMTADQFADYVGDLMTRGLAKSSLSQPKVN